MRVGNTMIKNKKSIIFIFLVVTLIGLLIGFSMYTRDKTSQESQGRIYLYGEAHAVKKILDREIELWDSYYHDQGMRHLFIEVPYYTAELLNQWMQSDHNTILDELYNDWIQTPLYSEEVKLFYEQIKKEYPETIFHGTDVGHQYLTTGKRYLKYLESNGLENSEQYQRTQEVIEQGRHYYSTHDEAYRENKMVENFIYHLEKIKGEPIMGIYGAAHTGLEDMNYTNEVPSMANQLKEIYGKRIYSEDLSYLKKAIEPLDIEIFKINGKDYEAAYFGEQDISELNKGYTHRKFWRLEKAYDDFRDASKIQDVLPYNNYPMLIEEGQVFVIDYVKKDGTVERKYYRSDGDVWQGMLVTQAFRVSQ